MTQSWPDYAKASTSSLPSTSHPEFNLDSRSKKSGRNVLLLLASREISPQTRRTSRRFVGDTSLHYEDGCRSDYFVVDAKRSLESWVEADSLHQLTAKYCPLLPPPRSTIAAAFSSDGKKLASTHGDHTVKIIDCQTGKRLKVLSGHRRTPWVVRFHPLCSQILASGSLDHEVRLWDADTNDCICSHVFYRPIASIAFHAQGEFLAVASGHKLFIWNYKRTGEASVPTIILKTRRSLRAVHFHPHGAPLLLTAEVNYLDSTDSPLTLATSSGYSKYPPPAIFISDSRSPSLRNPEDGGLVPPACLLLPPFISEIGSNSRSTTSSAQQMPEPMDSSPANAEGSGDIAMSTAETVEGQTTSNSPMSSHSIPPYQSNFRLIPHHPSTLGNSESIESGQIHHIFPLESGPYLPAWLTDPRQGSLHQVLSSNNSLQGVYTSFPGINPEALGLDLSLVRNFEPTGSVQVNAGNVRATGRPISRHRSRYRAMDALDSEERIAQNDENESQFGGSNMNSEVTTSLVAAAVAELPCTVKLRLWLHDIHHPSAPLDSDRCRLTIPHAVLCSEMGAHFSPCGRFLAACVACVLPHMEVDHGLSPQMQPDASGVATSPTRHPISSHQVMYELRVYSLEEITFGMVLASRAIRAAHCLTSIQFSPTSEHVLMAYGRRHSSLLRSVVCNGESTIPIFTILEVYRASDMELVKVLPSSEDEVNVACFHPLVGGGLVYGTKEGKLRILQYEDRRATSHPEHSFFVDEHLMEVQR